MRPFTVLIRFAPVLLELPLQLIVPLAVALTVLRAGAVAKAVSVLCLLIGGLAPRWNGLLSRRLFHGVIHILIGIRFIAAEVMFGLIPIAFKCRLDPFPGRIIVFSPPFRISCVLHNRFI